MQCLPPAWGQVTLTLPYRSDQLLPTLCLPSPLELRLEVQAEWRGGEKQQGSVQSPASA